MRPQFSIVLPLHNQADQVPRITGIVRAALADLDATYEMLLVVNGCSDGTMAQAQRAESNATDIVVLESAAGWGSAVLMGLRHARGDILCYTNSARVNGADLTLALRYGLVNDGVVVKASRKLRERPLRRIGSVLYNLECRGMFGLAVWDVNGTPKVFHRSLLPALRLTERGDLIDLELAVNAKLARIPIVEMPVYDTRRISGKATTNLRAALRMYSKPLAMRSRLLSNARTSR